MYHVAAAAVGDEDEREKGWGGVEKGRRDCQSGGAVCQTDSVVSHMTIILILTAMRTSNLS